MADDDEDAPMESPPQCGGDDSSCGSQLRHQWDPPPNNDNQSGSALPDGTWSAPKTPINDPNMAVNFAARVQAPTTYNGAGPLSHADFNHSGLQPGGFYAASGTYDGVAAQLHYSGTGPVWSAQPPSMPFSSNNHSSDAPTPQPLFTNRGANPGSLAQLPADGGHQGDNSAGTFAPYEQVGLGAGSITQQQADIPTPSPPNVPGAVAVAVGQAIAVGRIFMSKHYHSEQKAQVLRNQQGASHEQGSPLFNVSAVPAEFFGGQKVHLSCTAVVTLGGDNFVVVENGGKGPRLERAKPDRKESGATPAVVVLKDSKGFRYYSQPFVLTTGKSSQPEAQWLKLLDGPPDIEDWQRLLSEWLPFLQRKRPKQTQQLSQPKKRKPRPGFQQQKQPDSAPAGEQQIVLDTAEKLWRKVVEASSRLSEEPAAKKLKHMANDGLEPGTDEHDVGSMHQPQPNVAGGGLAAAHPNSAKQYCPELPLASPSPLDSLPVLSFAETAEELAQWLEHGAASGSVADPSEFPKHSQHHQPPAFLWTRFATQSV